MLAPAGRHCPPAGRTDRGELAARTDASWSVPWYDAGRPMVRPWHRYKRCNL